MAPRISVGGTEVVTDLARIPWPRLKNAPVVGAVKNFTISTNNCAFHGRVGATLSFSGREATLNFGTSDNPAANCNCNCACGGGTCFLPTARVLMADGRQLALADVRPGNRVVTLAGHGTVVAVEHIVKLGPARRIIGFDDTPPFASDDHSIWTRFEDGAEFWGTYNYSHWLQERADGEVPDGLALPHSRPLIRTRANRHAHVSGWRSVRPIYYPSFGPSQDIMNLVVDHGSYVLEGYVYSSMWASRPNPALYAGARWSGVRWPAARTAREFA